MDPPDPTEREAREQMARVRELRTRLEETRRQGGDVSGPLLELAREAERLALLLDRLTDRLPE